MTVQKGTSSTIDTSHLLSLFPPFDLDMFILSHNQAQNGSNGIHIQAIQSLTKVG